MHRVTRRVLLAAPAVLPLARGAAAQTASQVTAAFPSRPVRMMIPFPPGGGSDILGRVVAQRMGEALGQPTVSENRSGAGGNIGTDAVAKSVPDGHTLLVGFNTLVVNLFLYRSLPFDLFRDFAPVARVATIPAVIAAGPRLPREDLAAVVRRSREQPGALNHGTPGLGTITHVSAELMDSRSGGRMTQVHYRGTGPAVTAATSGEVDLVSAPWSAVEGLVRGGQLRVLASIGAGRSVLLPADVPTVAEAADLPGYAVDLWGAVLAPSGTPAAVIARLEDAVRRSVDNPEGRAALAARGFEAAYADGAALARIMREDAARWEPVVRAANISLE